MSLQQPKIIRARILPASISRSLSSVHTLSADPYLPCIFSSCILSCNHIANSNYHRLITLDVPTNFGRNAKVLIDCGATTNFINTSFVLSNHIPTTTIDNYQTVKLADGSKYTTNKLVHSLHMFIQNREMCEPLLVLPLNSFDIILGMPFLYKYNPQINWIDNSLTFPSSPLAKLLHENNKINKHINNPSKNK